MKNDIPSIYDDLIWKHVLEHAHRKRAEFGGSIVTILAETKLSKKTIQELRNRSVRKWQNGTRELLLKYIGYNNIDEFKQSLKTDERPKDELYNISEVMPQKPTVSIQRLRHNIPFRPDYCIGRERKLKEIHETLISSRHHNNVVLLNGVGGMGKSTLMQEYLHREECNLYFDRIIVTSVNKDLVEAFIMAAEEALQIEAKDILWQDRLIKVIKKMRSYEGNNLFVIDNVNECDYDDLVEMKIHFNNAGWTFLVTTRTAPNDFTQILTDELEEKAAALLFAYHYAHKNEVDKKSTDSLFHFIEDNQLGGDIALLLEHALRHTLLIELLAKVGNVKQIGVIELLELLQQQDFKHPELQRIISIGHHASNTFRPKLSDTTLCNYLLCLFETDKLLTKTGNEITDKVNEANLKTLRFFSILPPDDMAIKDMIELWRLQESEIIEFENRLDELRKIGWLQSKEKKVSAVQYLRIISYKMHLLVQKIVYDKLKPNIENCTELFTNLEKILNTTEKNSQKYLKYAKFMIEKLESMTQL